MWCRADVEECTEVDASQMTAKLEYVPIDRLERYVGKKVRAVKPFCGLPHD